MRRTVLAIVIGLVVLAGSSASAHHNYAAYVTENRVTIEGDLEELRLMNPHVIMKIRTADSTVYTVSWQAWMWVQHVAHVTPTTFEIGDHLVIYGAPSRDPAVHELASLREVRRPSDGWMWRAQY